MELLPGKKGRLLGSGGERRVFKHPERPKEKLVTEEGSKHPLQVKAMFYTQRILSELCPDYFPDFTSAFVDENGKGAVIRERIRETGITKVRRVLSEGSSRIDALDTKNSYKRFGQDQYQKIFLREIPSILQEYGIEVKFDFSNKNNFRLKKGGAWNYVDATLIRALPDRKDLGKISEKMKQAFSQDQTNKAITAMERMYHIQDEMQKFIADELRAIESSDGGVIIRGIHIPADEDEKSLFQQLGRQLELVAAKQDTFKHYPLYEAIMNDFSSLEHLRKEQQLGRDVSAFLRASSYTVSTFKSNLRELSENLRHLSDNK